MLWLSDSDQWNVVKQRMHAHAARLDASAPRCWLSVCMRLLNLVLNTHGSVERHQRRGVQYICRAGQGGLGTGARGRPPRGGAGSCGVVNTRER